MKNYFKKSLSFAMAGAMLASAYLSTGVSKVNAEETWIGDEQVTENTTAEPAKDTVIPDLNQYRYQKEELAAFCHFGPNTFNEIEWGEHYGNKTPNEIFKLREDFDADTLVRTLKEAGFKKLIVTAKHHDGFCIWNSKYTDYDVANTDYKSGQGDILAEISKACTEQGLDMGLYLSPWDIHDKSYGYYDKDHRPTDKNNDALDYNEYYNNQLQEILGNDKYGNNGHFVEVWMDGAKGSGANAQEYNFTKWFDTIQKNEGKASGKYDADCMLFGAEAYTTVRWIGNESGAAAKDTWAKSNTNKTNNTIDSNKQGSYTVGFENGNQWTVPEADARITSGWFWGTQKNTPKTMGELSNMYFNSVGHNATLLLNVPPNNKGKVDQPILDRVKEFGVNVRDSFKTNLAAQEGASVKANNVRGNSTSFKPGNTVDGKDDTYWTTADGKKEGQLLIELGGQKKFDVVSIEEAIQNGQHINSYKVEVHNKAGEWVTVDSGKTIGAKRLSRFAPVVADQVRITVGTTEGKVPQLSEVGVYKVTHDFEMPSIAPEGMDVLDVKTGDDCAFKFSNGWHPETGTQYLNNTNTWANANATFDLKFHGSKVYLVGTKDPNHGAAEISIDNGEKTTVNTHAGSRSVGQIWYESPDLKDGDHTLHLKVKDHAIGIEGAFVINNGELGMVGFENSDYAMNENERKSLKLVRVGGSKGELTVTAQPNPGSAIQDDYNTTLIPTVTFKNGQTEATVDVETRRNTNKTGDQYFTTDLSSTTKKAILGFNSTAKITIKDTESITKDQLRTLVEEGEALSADVFVSGWEAYDEAIKSARVVVDNADATAEQVAAAVTAINKAKEGLVVRTQYTEADPFNFPWRKDSRAVLEAEFGQLQDNVHPNDGQWKLCVTEGAWASNGKFVNCFNQGDTLSIPYAIEKPGTYHVEATYRSGSASNKLVWTDANKNIENGEVVAGNPDANVTKTVSFDIKALKAGTGTLVFTGPDTKSPQLDKLTITPGDDIKREQFTVTAEAGENGQISAAEASYEEGSNASFTFTPAEGYKVAQVIVNGEAVKDSEGLIAYTIKDIRKNTTIRVEFTKDEAPLKDILAGLKFATTVDGDTYTLPAAPEGTALTITASDNEAVIDTNGHVTPAAEDTKVTLTVQLTRGNEKATTTVVVTVKGTNGGEVQPEPQPTTTTVIFKSGEDTFFLVQSAVIGERLGILPENVPEKEGYKFVCWTTQDGTEVTADTTVTADMVIVAKFEKIGVTPTPETNKPTKPESGNKPTAKPEDGKKPVTGDERDALPMAVVLGAAIAGITVLKKRG